MNFINRIIEVGEVDPKTLIPNPKNWRKHPTKQADAVADILNEIGWIQDVIVNKRTGRVVDGHLRIDVAIKNKESTIPVSYVDLSEDEEEKALLSFDPLGAMAEGDKVLMSNLMESVSSDSEAVNKMMGDLAKEYKIESPQKVKEDDFVPPETVKTDIQRGDVILLGRHRLLCGDSTSPEDISRLMDGKKADMLLTDPPYGVSYVGKTKDALTIENDTLSEADLSNLVTTVFDNIQSVCREGAYWYATVPAGPLHILFADDWKRRGVLRQIMVWIKDSMVLGHSEYHYKHEPILFGWVPGGERHKNTDRTRTTVWEYARPKASREHPTMKPLDLWGNAIKDGSIDKEIVVDPFLGSGTTLIAAEQLDRICYGIEISPEYCEVICQRWEKLTNGKRGVI